MLKKKGTMLSCQWVILNQKSFISKAISEIFVADYLESWLLTICHKARRFFSECLIVLFAKFNHIPEIFLVLDNRNFFPQIWKHSSDQDILYL